LQQQQQHLNRINEEFTMMNTYSSFSYLNSLQQPLPEKNNNNVLLANNHPTTTTMSTRNKDSCITTTLDQTMTNHNNNNNNNNSILSVLLVHVQQHIFEVIAMDCYYKDDCAVRDVLSKARSSATDPALSEQKYISLVYDQQEFAAPMLKIHAAVNFRCHNTNNNNHHHHSGEQQQQQRRQPLAIAVPEGSNRAQVQYIKKILWRNPKMKRWWNVRDPFQPPKMEVIREIRVPSPTRSNTKQQPQQNNNYTTTSTTTTQEIATTTTKLTQSAPSATKPEQERAPPLAATTDMAIIDHTDATDAATVRSPKEAWNAHSGTGVYVAPPPIHHC
jgi:hypothetical protein